MGRGASEVELAAGVAVAGLRDVMPTSAVSGSRADWGRAIGALQRVIDVASAAQDAAIARLAAIEPDFLDDGTEVESHRALGHLALDAPAILSGVLSVSAVHAERRVRTAVHLAADGPAGTATETGLGALHVAMASGRLDAYRASVVAAELEEAPPEVRAAVVAAIDPQLESEDAAHLRRRCRRTLARISPDLLRQRAQRARAECCLRRWVDEPGVDRWEGTFPSEDAAQAWAAIDALAQRYVADGTSATVERARARALTDLVAGNATVETVLTLTVPAGSLEDHDLTVDGRAATGTSGPEAVDGLDGRRPGPSEGQAIRGTDPRGTFVEQADYVEVSGTGRGPTALVSRIWLAGLLDVQRSTGPASCHPRTGALLGWQNPTTGTPGPGPAHRAESPEATVPRTPGYRPPPQLAALVRARDRRCRFPGCTVAAVFCDLDHVRPWPAGPTTAGNLLCLCRRHHRIKQRPGWRVVLSAGAVASWTDPTGRVRTTHAVDALHVLVLHGAERPSRHGAVPAAAVTTDHRVVVVESRPCTLVSDGPHSILEFRHEHAGATTVAVAPGWRDGRGRHRVDIAWWRSSATLGPWHQGRRPAPRRRRPRRDPDEPPF